MKFNISKEWIEKNAKLEDGMSIEAGSMARVEWLTRCAAVFRTKAAMEPNLAMQFAEANLESLNYDLTENPEQAAEDEMDCWTD